MAFFSVINHDQDVQIFFKTKILKNHFIVCVNGLIQHVTGCSYIYMGTYLFTNFNFANEDIWQLTKMWEQMNKLYP